MRYDAKGQAILSQHGLSQEKECAEALEPIIKIRNKVSHTSCLYANDFYALYERIYAFFCNYMGDLLAVKKAFRTKINENFALGGTESSFSHLGTLGETDTVGLQLTSHREVIFTNLEKLGLKFFGNKYMRNSKDELIETKSLVESCLQSYMNNWINLGADYRLLDVGAELDGMGWEEYARRLNQFCREEFSDVDTTPVYVFIIGGNDVIPMPCVLNPFFPNDEIAIQESVFERNLEADMLYAYSGEWFLLVDMDGRVNTEKIVGKPRYLMGRLPLEEGQADSNDKHFSPFDEFRGYFQRAIENMMHGVRGEDGNYYVNDLGLQIRNHVPTTCETNVLAIQEMLKGVPLAPRANKDQFIQQNVYVSPALNLEQENEYNSLYAAEVEHADMLTFILHGGDRASRCNYLGQYSSDLHQVDAFTPEMMRHSAAKVVSGICCWGARYIGFSRAQSMLLSALYSHTLLFVGACRSARGTFDIHLKAGGKICLAQRLMNNYLTRLVSGMPAGWALATAKNDYLQHHEGESFDDVLATALEFNLYGDPSMFVSYNIPEAEQPITMDQNEYAWTPSHVGGTLQYSTEKKVLYSRNQSLADRVRGLVDANLRDIKDRITQKLYAEYGLSPDELSTIHTMHESSGTSLLRFTYSHPTNKGTLLQAYVDTDEMGTVRCITNSI
jgi:hypothetical protein